MKQNEIKEIMNMAKIADHMEKIENGVVNGYKRIENGVVNGYKRIENGVVGAYKKVEDAFVNTFIAKEGESVTEAKERLTGKEEK